MLKLRKILLHDSLYYIVLLISLTTVIIKISISKNTSKYDLNTKNITGKIISITKNSDQIKLIISAKEKVLVTYYSKENEDFYYNLGDEIEVFGELSYPQKNTAKYLFNYQDYLKHNKIYFIIEAKYLNLINKNKNIFYFLKQKVYTYLNNPYLATLIIGNKTSLPEKASSSYQKNGISHLFAISGMHITLLSTIILKVLKKFKLPESKSYFFTSIFLILYLCITGIKSSILRGIIFFILHAINDINYLYIKPINIFITTLAISLLINENFIYDLGFWYSYSISFSLIIMSSYIKSKSKTLTLLKTSLISFIVSLPISLYNFHEINILSIIYNIFIVPYVSIIVFPLAIITVIFPFLLPLFSISTTILEKTSLFLNKITIFSITFPHLNIFIYGLYIIFVILFMFFLTTKNKRYFYPLPILLICHYLYPYINNSTYIKLLDVGQGDSILLHSGNESILIDTGGIMSTKRSKNDFSIVEEKTIPILKSLGIRKLDKIILTHGDFDHIGEALNLLENFKVKEIIINDGTENYLEKKITENYNVTVAKKGYFITCGDIELLQLNKTFPDENNSSQIYYGVYKSTSMLFMGDAGIASEQYILEEYNLQDITILKVGHHGSNTSSSKAFIERINPKVSLISVGKNNKFNHPSQEVIKTLKNNYSTIYRTDISNTITIDLKHLKIETTN